VPARRDPGAATAGAPEAAAPATAARNPGKGDGASDRRAGEPLPASAWTLLALFHV